MMNTPTKIFLSSILFWSILTICSETIKPDTINITTFARCKNNTIYIPKRIKQLKVNILSLASDSCIEINIPHQLENLHINDINIGGRSNIIIHTQFKQPISKAGLNFGFSHQTMTSILKQETSKDKIDDILITSLDTKATKTITYGIRAMLLCAIGYIIYKTKTT